MKCVANRPEKKRKDKTPKKKEQQMTLIRLMRLL